MKKIIFTIIFSMLLLPISVLAAQNGQSDNAQSGQGNANSTTSNSSDDSSQNQVRTETQTNNPDFGTMTQEQIRTELNTEIQESKPSFTPQNTTNQQHMNQVAAAIENIIMLSANISDTTIGEQVRIIARNQGESEDVVNQSLEKAQNRSAFAKFFIGPNYKELKTVKQEMEQNRLRIQELNQIMSNISNQGDQTNLQNQIQVLEEQNTSLEEQLNKNIQGFSLFGWLSKLMNNF